MSLLNNIQQFFKPTWRKVVYPIIFTLFPYVLGLIFAGWPNNSDWNDLVFWLAAWSPLLFVDKFLPHYLTDDIWLSNNEFFLFYVYPLLSFFLWYLISCIIDFFIKKLKKMEKSSKKQNIH